MPLYCDTGVSVESWVEMKTDVDMKYEIDKLNDLVGLSFGETYFLTVSKENLMRFVELGTKAINDLETTERQVNAG